MGYINYWLREPPEDEGIDPDGRIPPYEVEEYEFYADDDIAYKFNENELIRELQDYIDSTYGGHYGQGGLQSSEVIIDRGHGMGFFLGNVDKYNARYGKKGTPEDQRKDIVKIIHYGFLALFEHDRLHGK